MVEWGPESRWVNGVCVCVCVCVGGGGGGGGGGLFWIHNQIDVVTEFN